MVCLACAFAFLAAAASASSPSTAPVLVTIDTGHTRVESFMGLGVQWDPYEYVPSTAPGNSQNGAWTT
jgi:hypothetical protein